MKMLLKVLAKILSTLLSIVLLLGICTYLVLTISVKVVTKDNVKELVKYSNINEVLDSGFSNAFYSIANDNNIDSGIIDGIVNSVEFKELIGEYTGSLVENVFYNTEVKKVTSSEIVEIARKNLDRATNEMGYTLSKEQKESILSEVDKVSKEFIENASLEDNLSSETLNNIKIVRTIFSDKIRILVLVTILVITALIVVLNWSIYKFAIWIGIPTIISGGLVTAFGYAIGNMITITNYPEGLTNFISNNISPIFMKYGIIVLVIGIIEAIYYKVIKIYFNKENIN